MRSDICAIAVASALAVWSPYQARAQNQNDLDVCAASTTSDTTIEACTRALDSDLRVWTRRSAIALSLRAWAWKAKGDPNRAAADFTEAIRMDSDFAPAYEGRGNLLRDANQCAEAVEDYDIAIKLQSDRAQNYYGRALCTAQSDPERAASDLDQVIKLDANNIEGRAVDAWGMKARIALVKGDSDAAVVNFEQAIKLAPQRSELYIDRGGAWNEKGDPEKALTDYDRAIELDATNAEGYAVVARMLKGRLQASRGNVDAAVAEYEEAVKLDPKRVALYLDRAALWNLKGDNERALADYDEAIKVDPQNAAAYVARGDFRRGKGEYPQAIADYDQATEKQPDDLTAYGNRALARFYAGAFAEATGDFKRVADAQVNAYPALLLYVSRFRHGDVREAKTELTKSASRLKAGEWPYPIVDLYLGKKSAQAAEGAAKTPGEKCEAQFYIGEWHLLRKDRSEAAKALQAAADSCPKNFIENRAAAEELKRLK